MSFGYAIGAAWVVALDHPNDGRTQAVFAS